MVTARILVARIAAVWTRPVHAWVFVLLGVVVFGGQPAFAQAPASCEPLLTTAEERYIQREFAEAETLVRACLAQPERTDTEAVQSYRLLALIALRQDDTPSAERAVRQLLSLAPEYAPDPIQDPPAYVELVTVVEDQMRAAGDFPPADSVRAVPPAPQGDIAAEEPEIEIVRTDPEEPEAPTPTAERPADRERGGITRWLLIGGGVVVASVAAVLLTSGGSSPPPSGGTPLPPPPPFPQ